MRARLVQLPGLGERARRRSRSAARSPPPPSRTAPGAPAPTRSRRRRRRPRSRGRPGSRARRSPSRIASASGVVGPFAPSSTIAAWTRSAFAAVMTTSSAHGASTSHGSASSSSFVIAVAGVELGEPPAGLPCGRSPPRRRGRPRRSGRRPSPRRRRPMAPASETNLAKSEPTLPNPCIATFSPSISRPWRRRVSRRQKKTPRPVASSRPSEPPTASGLPVTTLSTEWPLFIEKVSKIHAITAGRRADVGSRDVLLGPDLVHDLGRVAAGHPLELAQRQRLRVADHAALGAAERAGSSARTSTSSTSRAPSPRRA